LPLPGSPAKTISLVIFHDLPGVELDGGMLTIAGVRVSIPKLILFPGRRWQALPGWKSRGVQP
jgi:hypothetical protein